MPADPCLVARGLVDSRINFGSSGGPEVVAEQPSSFISVAVSVGGIADGLSN